MKWPTVGREADRVRAIEDPLALILPDAEVTSDPQELEMLRI
jgi:hypothetical protein